MNKWYVYNIVDTTLIPFLFILLNSTRYYSISLLRKDHKQKFYDTHDSKALVHVGRTTNQKGFAQWWLLQMMVWSFHDLNDDEYIPTQKPNIWTHLLLVPGDQRPQISKNRHETINSPILQPNRIAALVRK